LLEQLQLLNTSQNMITTDEKAEKVKSRNERM